MYYGFSLASIGNEPRVVMFLISRWREENFTWPEASLSGTDLRLSIPNTHILFIIGPIDIKNIRILITNSLKTILFKYYLY